MRNPLRSPGFRASRGFSLIELMVVLIILGILIAWALPSFSTTIRRNRVTTETNELVLGLSVARSEAIKRNRRVTICSASSATACGGTWDDGWLVYSDDDESGALNGSEEVIRRGEGDDDVDVAGVGMPNAISFDGRGRPIGTTFTGTDANPPRLVVEVADCASGEEYARKIVLLGSLRRPRLLSQTETVGTSSETGWACT